MPRLPAVEPKAAIATMRVRPGFKMELAAAERMSFRRLAMAFDEDGRLYVVEMIDYSERRDEKLGRIRLLERHRRRRRLRQIDGLRRRAAWPTAVFPWKGGVFVGCTPDILYLKDTDGDGRADERRVVLPGFAEGRQAAERAGAAEQLQLGLG